MEPDVNLSLLDIVFNEHSEVFAQKLGKVYTEKYIVITGTCRYGISLWGGVIKITFDTYRGFNKSPPPALFYEKLNINSFNKLETFILSKLLLE
jgi:hypothetical protein